MFFNILGKFFVEGVQSFEHDRSRCEMKGVRKGRRKEVSKERHAYAFEATISSSVQADFFQKGFSPHNNSPINPKLQTKKAATKVAAKNYACLLNILLKVFQGSEIVMPMSINARQTSIIPSHATLCTMWGVMRSIVPAAI